MADNDQDKLHDSFGRKAFSTGGVIGTYLAAAWIIGFTWTVYLLNACFNFDLLSFLHSNQDRYQHDDPGKGTFYLILAIAGTVIAVPWSVLKARKTRGLAVNGVRTKGKIIAKGLLGRAGLVPVTVSFSVNGKEYKFKKDAMKDRFAVGDEIDILYDPGRPSNCAMM